MQTASWTIGAVLAVSLLVSAPKIAESVSIRNVYFTGGTFVRGQTYAREGQLPGPTTTFTRGQDEFARLVVILGDLDAHSFRGELKAADGTVVRTMNRTKESVKGTYSWTFFVHGFALKDLAPGEYSLDLIVDDVSRGVFKFTLK